LPKSNKLIRRLMTSAKTTVLHSQAGAELRDEDGEQ